MPELTYENALEVMTKAFQDALKLNRKEEFEVFNINITRKSKDTICDYCKKSGDCEREPYVSELFRNVTKATTETTDKHRDVKCAGKNPFNGLQLAMTCDHPDFEQYKRGEEIL